MIRLRLLLELDYEVAQPGCDFIFNIHAAQTPHQIVVQESLGISQALATNLYTDPVTRNRYLRHGTRLREQEHEVLQETDRKSVV